MTKIAIIDDEFNVRELLKKLVTLIYKDAIIVGEAASVKQAKKMLATSNPDIVLLDIELEDGTGFGLLDELETINFKIVFITAFNQHAIKAFKYNAVDYLLKPISPKEFKSTLDKVLLKVSEENELQLLIAQLKKGKDFEPEKIIVNTVKEKHILQIDDILYLESEGAYTKIITKDLSVLASKNLKHFEDLLPKYQFIRSHQSFLANKKHIVGIRDTKLILINTTEIPISSRRRSEVNTIVLKRK